MLVPLQTCRNQTAPGLCISGSPSAWAVALSFSWGRTGSEPRLLKAPPRHEPLPPSADACTVPSCHLLQVGWFPSTYVEEEGVQ